MKTAVEWLYERLERMIPRTALYNIDKKEYLEQAKEMEKQQIIDAYNNCIKDRYNNALVDMGFKEKSEKCYNTGKEYYNETFNK